METNKNSKSVFERWVPRNRVKEFFGYGQTKMSSFAKDFNVRSKKIGNRLFFYADDIEKLLESDMKDEG